VKTWAGRVRTRTLVIGFLIYSWAATTLSAAWFLRRSAAADGKAFSLTTALFWQGAVFGLWVIAAGFVWLLIRMFSSGTRLMVAMAAVMPFVVLLQTCAAAALDATLGGHGWTGWTSRAIDKIPVAILLWTALCAAGLAASQRERAMEARQRALILEDALREARQAAVRQSPDQLLVMSGSRRVAVRLDEVEWLASAGNYVVVHWSGREGLLRETLKVMEARLDAKMFARSHRSTLVNLARVASAESLSDGSWKLVLASGAELVASRTYRDEFLTRLGR
jgi:DNA-binding LytR/AlgR family response regulator